MISYVSNIQKSIHSILFTYVGTLMVSLVQHQIRMVRSFKDNREKSGKVHVYVSDNT